MTLAACAQGIADDPAPRAIVPPPSSVAAPESKATDELDSGVEIIPDAEADTAPATLPEAGPISDASTDAPPVVVVVPPTVDGVIANGEYGVHVDGQNQASTSVDPSTTQWLMTWTETHLYVGVTAANPNEAIVLYVDHSPLTPSNGGTDADGAPLGFAYDGTKPGSLPFRADFVAYVKQGYSEHRTWSANLGWSSPLTGSIVMSAQGNVRELSIPWTAIRGAGRPPSFSFLGYATSASGWVYGGVPVGNPDKAIGLNATFEHLFKVDDATPGTGSKPFAMKLGI